MSEITENTQNLSPLKRALVALKDMQAKLDMLEQAKAEPIAIVGMACRFPGNANDPEAFWQLLRNGVDAIIEVPSNRWNVDTYFDSDPESPGKMYTRWGGFLDGIEKFDAQFFGISPREAISMDPQQRLLLEVTWEALENAGQAPDKLVGSKTGIFVGITSGDYLQLQTKVNDPTRVDAYSGTGNTFSVAAGRLSYFLGFQGPSMAIDTACSSSLVAVHQACQSLRRGDSDMALAGGVNLILAPETSIYLSKVGALAADGRCKTFDAAANGYVRSEGCGMVVFKRLSDALANNDNILAVIRGTAINHDGRSSGLTVPNGQAQQAVIRAALADAGKMDPLEIGYVEAHGTGTPLGDPIEVRSLAAVLGQKRSIDEPLAIGSVKTNIGHLEAAAGVASLIKVVLSLQHGEIPPHLHLQERSPHVAWDEMPLTIPTKPTPWPAKNTRLAGVSSFGFSGTNAHVIVEAAPFQVPEPPDLERLHHILTLSAKSKEALQEKAMRFSQYLDTKKDTIQNGQLANACYTASVGYSHFEHRLAIVADEATTLQEKLAAFAAGREINGAVSEQISGTGKRKVAFLFTGQGAQYPGMGRQLYETQPTFRAALDKCDELLQPYLAQPLLSVIYPEDKETSTLIHETAYTQPALFALEYALAQLWQSWGVKPSIVMGHSVGEYVAACVAGVFSLEDGLKLIAERGRLMQTLPRDGAMAAVFATKAQVEAAIAPYADQISIAAVNGPENIVMSGLETIVESVLDELQKDGIKARRLTVSHAFHSQLMEPMLDDFEKIAASITYSKPRIGLISNITGQMVADEELTKPNYWRQHVRESVQFAAAIETLHKDGYHLFLEIGPHPTLIGMGQHCLPKGIGMWLSSLRKERDDWQQMLGSLSELYMQGINIDWVAFDQDYSRQRVWLPTYPFQRQRYWIIDNMPAVTPSVTLSPDSGSVPSEFNEWIYEVEWQAQGRTELNPEARQPGHWVILADEGGTGATLAQQLQAQGESCLIVRPQTTDSDAHPADKWLDPADPTDFQNLFRELIETTDRPLRGVVHLWSLDIPSPTETDIVALDKAQVLGCSSALHLIQALVSAEANFSDSQKADLPHLWLITRSAQPVNEAALALAQSPLWGLGKTIALEHHKLWGGLIDLDPDVQITDEATAIFAEISQPDGEQQLAFRQGQRYVARLIQNRSQVLDTQPSRFHPDGAYLITGGLGELGLQVAHWMAEQGAKWLILLGRTPLPPRESWDRVASDSRFANQIKVVQQLETQGARVYTAAVDVADEAQLAAFLTTYDEKNWPAIRGVVHAAGLIQDKSLLKLDTTALNAVLRPKVTGSWLLHRFLQDAPLDFFVLFSSAASLGGSPGQGNYAAANAFMDALAHYRHAQGQPALSINWGPWSEVGMAAKTDLEKQPARRSMGSIAPSQGLKLLSYLIWQDTPQVGVIPIRPAQLRQFLPVETTFTAQLDSDQPATFVDKPVEVNIVESLGNANSSERVEIMLAHLRMRIGHILMMDPAVLQTERNVMELGLDSIMVMELITKLDKDLHINLFPREIFERPSVEALAEYLIAQVEESGGLKTSSDSQPTASTTTPALVVGLNGLGQRPTPLPAIPATRNPGIIFLLSGPRSGSTLLRVMLAGHPDLFSPPELHLLPFNSLAERNPNLDRSYLAEGLQRAIMELTDLDPDGSATLLAEWEEQDLSIQEVYSRLQELAGSRALVDKTPSYTAHIEILERAELLFEKPKYIHLVRHPYAMIESFARNRMDKMLDIGSVDTMTLAEQVWATTNSNAIDFFEQIDPERHHLVIYEELVTQPEKVMRELCDFLGIPFHPALISPYEGERMTDGVHAQSKSTGDPNLLKHKGIDPTLADAWKQVTLPQRLGGFARRVAAELGYELPWPTPLADPEPKPVATERTAIQPVNHNGSLLLSFAQQRLMVIDQFEPGMATYNIRSALRMRGPLDVAALERSLNEIVQRHEALRTNIVIQEDGQPIQTILPTTTLPLPLINLETVSEADREVEMRRLVTEEIRRPFDLAQDLKLRALLLQLDKEDHVLVLTMHHIASDGWSLGVFMRELEALYEAFIAGECSPLLELPIQYADFAQWQRQWLQGEILETQLAYWKQKLNNPPVLELPTDRPRPAVQTYRGDRYLVTFSPELTASLKALSRREGVTLFMTLLAAFQTLLHRYTGQEDLTIGSPISGRNWPEIKELVGFFVNTLVMRTDLSGNPTFRELLGRVRQVTLEAYEHQDIPFEMLVEELHLARNLSHSPLFQVMFILQNSPMSILNLPNLTLTRLDDVNTGTSKFDLNLSLTEIDGGLTGRLEYNTDLFDEATMGRMMKQLETLLEGIVADPDQQLSDLPLLPEAEKRQLLIEWNDTKMDYPAEQCLHQLFEAQVDQTPEAIAIRFEDEALTYRQLNEQANQLAGHLRMLGVGADTLVGIYVERSIEMVVGLLGIHKSGGGYVPLDPAFPKDRLAFMLADSQAPVLLTQESLKDGMATESDVKVVCLDSDWELIAQQSAENLPNITQPDNLAYVIYTSGSTGKPKGVQLQHQGVVNFLTTMRQEPGLTSEDVLLSVTTLSFDISVLEIFLPLTTGAQIVLVSRETAADGLALQAKLAGTGATVMQATPTTWRLLIDSDWPGNDNLKVMCGGEALPRDLANQILERCDTLWNMYGPTETTIWSTVYQLHPGETGGVSIGRPIGNTQCYILDAHLRPVPIGVPGELHIGGDGLARGYMNREELTAEKFIHDPFSDRPGARLYKTGDLVRYLPDGNMEFLSRIDHQIKIRGFRVELGEIEAILAQHPAIRGVVVIVREDQPGDKRLVAYLIADNDQGEVSTSELRNFVRKELPEYMVPSAYVFLDAFPLTPNKKIDRKVLPAPDQARPDLEESFVPPRDDVEETIAATMADILKLERVGIYDNFFDLGGHSLLATQLVSQLRQEFEVDLPLRSLFEAPTVAGLGLSIVQKKAEQIDDDKLAQLLSALEESISE